MIKAWKDFSDYIVENYKKSSKIIEVGVGKILDVGCLLKEKMPDTDVKLVDLYPANEHVICDDITNPTDVIYQDADLIYSIRPPEELQPDIMNLADKYETDVIIKPLFTEEINYKYKARLKLVNYKRLSFYHYKR